MEADELIKVTINMDENLMQSQQNLGGIPVLLCDYSIFANKDQTNSRTSNNSVYVSGCFRNCQQYFYHLLFGTDLFTISNSSIVPNDVTTNLLSAPERVKDAMDVFIESRQTEDS